MATDAQFLQARTQIVSKINKLETDLKYWREELQAFDRVETTMLRLVSGGGNGHTPDLELKAEESPGQSDSDAAALENVERAAIANALRSDAPKRRGDLKNRVLAVIQQRKGSKVSSTDVERAILQSGYKPVGQHFDITVYQTLKRLARAKLIKRKKYAGNVTYSANTE